MQLNKINPVPAIVIGAKASAKATVKAAEATKVTKATKVSAVAVAKGVKVSGRVLRDGTLFVTDYTELGVEKTRDVMHNSVVVPMSVSVIAHRNAKADRVIERAIRREERKAKRAALKVEMAKVAQKIVEDGLTK